MIDYNIGLPDTENVTLNVINLIFNDIAARHAFIQGYNMAPIYDTTAQTEQYQLLWVQPQQTQFTNITIDFGFSIMVADIVNKDNNNLIDVWSDTNQTLHDIIKMLQYEYPQYEYDLIYDFSATPFEDDFDDELAGWQIGITISVPRPNGTCDIPLK